MFVGNRLYDVLKFIALIFLPAVGALYAGLDLVWDLPKDGEVVQTIVVVDAFLGVFVKWLKDGYEEPEPVISGFINYPGDDENGMPKVGLTIQRHPEEMVEDGIAHFKVTTEVPLSAPEPDHE